MSKFLCCCANDSEVVSIAGKAYEVLTCTRFLRFSYLLDFVALEALSNIFIESVKDTVKKLIDLSGVHPDFELKKV